MWLIGAVVCLCDAPRVQLFVSVGNGWPHDTPRYHWLLPLQVCKALLVASLTHVSSAIASTCTRPFTDHIGTRKPSWRKGKRATAVRVYEDRWRRNLQQICNWWLIVTVAALYLRFANCAIFSGVEVENRHFHPRYCDCRPPRGGTPSNIST